MKFFSKSISIEIEKKKKSHFQIKIYTVHQQNLKLWRGLESDWISSETGISKFLVTHEKFQKPETILDFF